MFGQTGKNSKIRLPFGSRDIFPLESSERNAIRRLIRKEFKSWGYGEVKTPVMEYTENISIGVGKDWKDKLINFLDIDGNLISLRADMTIPIARLAGMRLGKDQLPARFCYFADIFRQAGSQAGNKRVFSQAGLEFLGSVRRMEADAEVMIILIRILKSLGLEDFRMVLGHIGFINGLFNWLKLDRKKRIDFKKYIVEKDFVRIEDMLKGYDSGKAGIFMGLMKPGNDLDKISAVVSDMGEREVSSAFDHLKGLYGLLKEQELGKYIVFDFSIIRDFDYYTGLLFEVYCRGITDIIGSGGRYDDLVKKFGKDIPATGFALDIDILHGALGEKDFPGGTKVMLTCSEYCDDPLRLMDLADSIREKGIDVEVLFDKAEDAVRLAGKKDCRFLVEALIDLSGFSVTGIEDRDVRILDKINFYKEIETWKKS
jgi:ATP phosphoribosyltransferase regulatory subunit